MDILDISLPLHPDVPCWPGKSPLALKPMRDMSRGDQCTCHAISMDIHLGTHIDAPCHFIRDGATVDKIPIATMVGPCRVVEFLEDGAYEIPAQIMAEHSVERVLFKTRNSKLLSFSKFDPKFVALSESLAANLVERGVRLVGIDYFSVDCFESENKAVHRTLLQAGVVILEGINLSAVEPGDYELVALPLNIRGAEGSPVRAILMR